MFEPKYQITNVILNNISRIESARAIITNAPLIPAWERKFQNEALIRTIHYSTHIEENPLSYKEVSMILGGQLSNNDVRIRDFQEIVNYREVLKFIEKKFEADKKIVISEELFLKIHKILTSKIIPEKYSGKYRTVPVVLVNSKTKGVSYKAPDAKKVPRLIKELFDWHSSIDNCVHPILKSGIIHTQIARIHPFVDANGRTSRAMATFSLLADGYDIRKFFCLEEHYDRDLPRYYKALQSVEKNSEDMTHWLEYFSEGLAEELSRIKEKVLSLSRDSKLKSKIGQIELTDRQVKILKYIQDYGYINNSEWRRILSKVSDDTVLRDLKTLLEKGLIKKEGKTKSAKYILKI